MNIDPARPEEFEIDWAGVPNIEERVAANDPALADPRGARRRVKDALEHVGVAGPKHLGPLPDGIGEVLARADEAKRRRKPRPVRGVPRARGSRAGARRKAARRGADRRDHRQRRAETGRWGRRGRHHDVRQAQDGASRDRPREAALRRADAEAEAPSGRGDIAGAGLPALVSDTDPNDVEILWDELPSALDQVASGSQTALRRRTRRRRSSSAGMMGPDPGGDRQGPAADAGQPTHPAGTGESPSRARRRR